MRILHLLSERGYSGGEHQLAHLLEHLKDRGHDSVMILNPGARFRATCDALALPVHEVRMRNDADFVAAFKLRRLFLQLEPDLIHFACSRGHKLGANAAAVTRRLPPRIATRRMDYPLGKSRYRRWLYGKAVHAVVAISEGVRREVLALGVPEDHVHTIHDGVETRRLAGLHTPARRDAARAQLGVGSDVILGLTSASLHVRKGHDILLEALARLEGTPLLWLIAGDGPEREKLEARARELGLLASDGDSSAGSCRVRFLGKVSPVDELLSAADVFCLPSRKEGLGVALLEAMAAGLACVGSAVGGILEAIEGEQSGLLFDVGDIDGLAGALGRCAADAELRRKLGGSASKRAADLFDIGGMCEKSAQLYARVAAEHRVARSS